MGLGQDVVWINEIICIGSRRHGVGSREKENICTRVKECNAAHDDLCIRDENSKSGGEVVQDEKQMLHS
jgi:hypothetical protein